MVCVYQLTAHIAVRVTRPNMAEFSISTFPSSYFALKDETPMFHPRVRYDFFLVILFSRVQLQRCNIKAAFCTFTYTGQQLLMSLSYRDMSGILILFNNRLTLVLDKFYNFTYDTRIMWNTRV